MNEKFLKTIRLYLDNINLNENEYFSLCSIKFNEVKEVVLCQVYFDLPIDYYKIKFNNYEIDLPVKSDWITLLSSVLINKKFKNNKIDIAFKKDNGMGNLSGNIIIYLYVDSYDYDVETATNVIEK